MGSADGMMEREEKLQTNPFPQAALLFGGQGQAHARRSLQTAPLLDGNQRRLPGGNVVPEPAL